MVFKYNTKIDISLERYVNNNILQSFGWNMFISFYFFMNKHKIYKEEVKHESSLHNGSYIVCPL